MTLMRLLLVAGPLGLACCARGAPAGPPVADQPPAENYPPNRLGDRCRHAPENACYAKLAGIWDCTFTNPAAPGQTFPLTFSTENNGYVRVHASSIGQQGAGCMDCSGAYATLQDGEGAVAPRGTFVVSGGNATIDWVYCLGSDIEGCSKAPQGTGHGTCSLAKLPAIP